jgi:uncharacterized sulfatase
MRQWLAWDPHYVDVVAGDPHTLPRELRRAGYASFEGGKYWEGDFALAGFDAGTARGAPGASLESLRDAGSEFGRRTLEPVLRFIDAHAEGRFFVWYAPMLPHKPHDPPREILARYAGRGLSQSAAAYYAMCTWFDDGVGRLLAHLERRGLRERTLVVYFSDNGWQQDPGVEETDLQGGELGKLSHHELAFRTPIVWHWPGRVPAGRVREDLVSTLDVYATLLAYAGLETPRGRLGVDLRPLLAGAGRGREELIGSSTFLRRDDSPPASGRHPAAWTREALFVLTDEHWHYAHNETSGREWLYERSGGPLQPRDRLAEHPELARRFRARIEAWKRSVVEALEE